MEKSEAKIQSEIFTFFWNNYCLPSHLPRSLMFHVANENQHRSNLKAIGLLSGVSDLIMVHRGLTYFIEVKTPDGRQSPTQKSFQMHVNSSLSTNHYIVIRSLDQFKAFLASL